MAIDITLAMNTSCLAIPLDIVAHVTVPQQTRLHGTANSFSNKDNHFERTSKVGIAHSFLKAKIFLYALEPEIDHGGKVSVEHLSKPPRSTCQKRNHS